MQAVPPVAFHLGFHKTGSTWLQLRFFAHHPQVHPVIDSANPWDSELVTHLTQPGDGFSATVAAELLAREASDAPSGSLPVVSAEDLSGSMETGHFQRFVIAERIAEAFPEARVLVVLRDPVELVESEYLHLVKHGLPLTLTELLEPRWGIPGFNLDAFEMEPVIARYRQIFGDRVLLLDHRLLASDMPEFCRRICAFLGLDTYVPPEPDRVSPSLRPEVARNLRLLNRARRSRFNPAPLVALPPHLLIRNSSRIERLRRGRGKPLLTEEERAALAARFASSRAALRGLDQGAAG